ELRSAGIALELAPNAENFFLDEGFLPSLGTEEARLLGKGPYALIEAPYTAPLTPLLEIIFRMKLKGVIPLIAHPERCYEFERKGRAAQAVQAGACLQLDVGALVGRYGPKAKKVALALLEENLYSVAATDLHSPRGAGEWLGSSLEQLLGRVGPRAFEALMKHNPRRMLAGETLV
ncbi:MAG TPA: CpsB/CapC family capsule biosynthesis tyrosine phosphatase, partial [Myxococcaceae bacterium]|nr:CpsB/CapC family capsule biosynthesis tyrosine phosphatase [Myxococcaceae bacterium]